MYVCGKCCKWLLLVNKGNVLWFISVGREKVDFLSIGLVYIWFFLNLLGRRVF